MKLALALLHLTIFCADSCRIYAADPPAASPGTAEQLYNVYLSRDYFALEKQLGSLDPQDPAHLFFEGQLDAAFLRDDQAKKELRRFLALHGMEADWRKEAWQSLGQTDLRDGDYDAAADDFARELTEPSPEFGASERKNVEALLDTVRILHGVPPQSRSDHAETSTVNITWGKRGREHGGWMYVDYRVNGLTETAIFDTGAELSIASESFAQRHGLHLLPGQVAVTASTGKGIVAQLGVADQVEIGTVRFEHVLFTVFKDEDFALSSTIGLPLIRPLGKLRVSFSESCMEVGPSSKPAAGPPSERNLAFVGDKLVTRLHYQGSDLPFRLDTGESDSYLFTSFGQRFPQAVRGSVPGKFEQYAVGGYFSAPARIIPQLELGVDDRSVLLHNIEVKDEPASLPPLFGTVGGDLLAGGYELDFHQMHFSLLGGTQPKSTEPPHGSPLPPTAP